MEFTFPSWLQLRESTVIACALVLLLVGVAHWTLHSYIQRRCEARATSSASELAKDDHPTPHWASAALIDLVAPVGLVLWIQGVHHALSMLLADITLPAVAQYGLPALDLIRGIGTMMALVWLMARVGRAVEKRLVAFSHHSRTRGDDFFLPIAGTAVRLLLPLLAVILGSSMLAVPDRLQVLFGNAVSILLVGALAYVLYRMVDAICDLILEKYRTDVADNRHARGIHTQVMVLRKVVVSGIVLFSFAAILMLFDQVRQIGTTILASAGVAGIVIGIAAQRSLGMLLAGFQIAMTQPIRLDDVVIVEGEWGKIEEITLTYVVVNIWDQRRLIVPMSYFLEKPFQNWTRTTAELLGTVELHLDYCLPTDELRQQLTTILNASPFWDRRVNVLQVTDTREHTVLVRALVSASNAGAAFDLRCEVREGLLKFLQQHHPQSLPRFRLVQAEASKPAAPATTESA